MYRKISNYIEEYLTGNEETILCIDGARQVGKSYIIRELAQKHFRIVEYEMFILQFNTDFCLCL